MSKELVNKENTEAVAYDADEAALFGADQISSNDIVIPKILAMQGLSKLVTEGKAVFGDFRDSLSGEKLGDLSTPLEIIPFYMEKVFTISKKNQKGKYEWEKFEPITAANENTPYEVGDRRFEYTFKFYVLLPNDMALPYIITFKSTSRRTGKEIATQMYVKNRVAGKSPVAKTFLLSGEKQTNDEGTFVVMKASVNRDTVKEEVLNCISWARTIRLGVTKEDLSDVKQEAETVAPVQAEASNEVPLDMTAESMF